MWLGTVVAVACVAGALPQARGLDDDLATTLERAAARVAAFFTRAMSLVCTETVYVQPLGYGLSGDGPRAAPVVDARRRRRRRHRSHRAPPGHTRERAHAAGQGP
jgi:hypothetical protein